MHGIHEVALKPKNQKKIATNYVPAEKNKKV